MKTLNKQMVLGLLVLCIVALAALHLITNHILEVDSYTLKHWFNLDSESNIPTWFSSSQLFLLFSLSILYAIQLDNKPLRRFYYLIGLIFLFFSADETSGIHESITEFSSNRELYSIFPDNHGMWILVYPIALLALGLVSWKGLVAFLKEKTGRLFFLAGAIVFIAGGVGCEVFGYYLPAFQSEESVWHIIEIVAEESLELLGQSLMIYALISKLYAKYGNNSLVQNTV